MLICFWHLLVHYSWGSYWCLVWVDTWWTFCESTALLLCHKLASTILSNQHNVGVLSDGLVKVYPTSVWDYENSLNLVGSVSFHVCCKKWLKWLLRHFLAPCWGYVLHQRLVHINFQQFLKFLFVAQYIKINVH